ncbi:MAG: hypothetical protein ACI33I_08845 [Clostridium sp.]
MFPVIWLLTVRKSDPNAQYKKVIGKSQALEYLREGNIKVIEEKVKSKSVKSW